MSEKQNISRPIKAFVIGQGKSAFYNPYKPRMPVRNAETSTQLTNADDRTAGEWIICEVDREGLEDMVDSSTILPQCIDAYATNIAGYGIGVRYREGIDETVPEAALELESMRQIINALSMESDTKTVFEHIVSARETFGASYLEVIRDIDGNVCQIDFIEDTASITRSVKDAECTDTIAWLNGQPRQCRKRFCHYKQEIGGSTVYYKEFGDPRIMDNRTGKYRDTDENGDLMEPLAPEYQANEILQFSIGPKPYGQIRWRGNVVGIAGASKAEYLNYNYFVNGRHTPLLIFLKGGMLDDESSQKLDSYMSSIKGEDGQHAFIVLCAESTGDVIADGTTDNKPDIELKDLSPMLQKDELFQDYIDRKRQQVQSAFRIPPLYVGYTEDYNRATAQTARQVTEEQVFKNERLALGWIINNKLLAEYGFQYVEAYFMEPDLTNPDDLHQLLTVCTQAGGVTPNMARDILCEQLGDQPEPFPEEWGDVPLQVGQAQTQSQMMQSLPSVNPNDPNMAGVDFGTLGLQLDTQIQNAAHDGAGEDVVSVMKSVRRLLQEMRDEKAE